MYEEIKYILKITGQKGPLILLFTSFILLWNKTTFLYYYFFGFFLNIILNLILKGLFKQPRPLEGKRIFQIALKYGSDYKYMNGIPFDMFGMPSGHAQSVFYSTVFIYLTLKNKKIALLYLLISLITLYQRVEYQMHTVLQVIIGSIIGAGFSYCIYYISQGKLVGNLMLKKDDNAYLNKNII